MLKAIREYFKKAKDGAVRFSMQSLVHDRYDRSICKGEIFWEMRDGATGALQDSGHLRNVVTLDASVLIARLMRSATSSPHVSEPSFGILALSVGTGDVGWNTNNPPPGNNAQRSLFNEIARKQIATASFVSPTGSISAFPTNVIDLTTTFAESEAVGGLTEMGLVGGDISTNMSIRNPALPANGIYDPTLNLVGLDTLVNYVTFPVINKPATSTLSWTWRLTF